MRPKIVYLDVSLTLTLPKANSHASSVVEAEELVRSYISSLKIGDNVLVAKIIEAALGVRRAVDVTDVLVTAQREDEIIESEIENIVITNEERAEPRKITVLYVEEE